MSRSPVVTGMHPLGLLWRGSATNPIFSHSVRTVSRTEVFGDPRLTAALLDRLTHRCHVIEFQGDTFRVIEGFVLAGTVTPAGGSMGLGTGVGLSIDVEHITPKRRQ